MGKACAVFCGAICCAGDTGLLLGDGAGFFFTWANAPPAVTNNTVADKKKVCLKFISKFKIIGAKMQNEKVS